MIPSDYRLQHVVARLIERLEGSRRSYSDAEAARSAFERITREHVEAAIGEYTEVGMADDPLPHAAFLRREVVETFLPRYLPLAVEMTALERRGLGLGWLGKPIGRFILPAIVLVLMVLAPRFRLLWAEALLIPLFVISPFVPDIAGMLARSRYRGQLEEIVSDMQVVQEQAGAYVPVEKLRIDDDPVAPKRRPQQRETP